jgi:hypothetical protein
VFRCNLQHHWRTGNKWKVCIPQAVEAMPDTSSVLLRGTPTGPPVVSCGLHAYGTLIASQRIESPTAGLPHVRPGMPVRGCPGGGDARAPVPGVLRPGAAVPLVPAGHQKGAPAVLLLSEMMLPTLKQSKCAPLCLSVTSAQPLWLLRTAACAARCWFVARHTNFTDPVLSLAELRCLICAGGAKAAACGPLALFTHVVRQHRAVQAEAHAAGRRWQGARSRTFTAT